ncbi:hypothetical protein QYM36_013663 [Artemia franciscana]|uniref:Uncharacterized protein n=1 Tax=Artemia franciscana TaxID=6661 RepID=A0AA88HN42_ARTSF|nr:hypothetical protein QYM36_013663 [Artemia franciscana]
MTSRSSFLSRFGAVKAQFVRDYTLPVDRRNITGFVKHAHEAYFEVKLGDQDKSWIPCTVCKTCLEYLWQWTKDVKTSLKAGISIVRREPLDYTSDYYFCAIDTTSISRKTNKFLYQLSETFLTATTGPPVHTREVGDNLLGEYKGSKPRYNRQYHDRGLPKLWCLMSIKMYFLFSDMEKFPGNLGAMSHEQRERSHQDMRKMKDRFYGLAHHCNILIPELNVEIYLNQKHKKKEIKMYKQKDVAGIFLTFTLKAIIECDYASLYITDTQDVNQETPKDYMCNEELKDGLRYTCSTYTLLRLLLGSDYMKVELISRIHFNPGTRVIGEKPECICVKDSEAMQLKVKELIQQFETEGFKREEIAVIETGQWKDVIKRNFPFRGKEDKISVICVNQNLESFTELETIIQELSSKGFKRTEFIIQAIMNHFNDKESRDNLKIHDLIEAISRVTTRVTIVYTNGDQLLSRIAQQFKEYTPQILPEDGYSKTYKIEEIF